MTTEAITTITEGMTASRLTFQRLGRSPGALEAALDTTPGLAALGAFLPARTVVRLPIPTTSEAARSAPVVVTLWD